MTASPTTTPTARSRPTEQEVLLLAFHLADVLTVAGAVASAALITGFIALLKNLGSVGKWIDASNEPIVAFVLSAALVVAAFVDAGTRTPEGAFAAFLAWYGIATIAMGVHDQVATRGSNIIGRS